MRYLMLAEEFKTLRQKATGRMESPVNVSRSRVCIFNKFLHLREKMATRFSKFTEV